MLLEQTDISELAKRIEGELFTDELHKRLYATDASVYREIPLGVVFPKHEKDLQEIIRFANQHKIAVIPRAGGTSLAGQVVGNGLVVDCSKHMNQLLEINKEEKWARVQPGVVLDELNQQLEHHNLFFGPETSTSTHCTIGGMFGNNSCGTHSIIYQTTREHVLEAKVILSNGEVALFSSLSNEEFLQKTEENSFEGELYKKLHQTIKHPNIQEKIKSKFPNANVIRRNTGYALDYLVQSSMYSPTGEQFNMCKLLAGSEGTLAFTSSIKINLIDTPPPFKAVVCVHHTSIAQSCKANLVALKCKPTAIELMDDLIIDLARQNPVQKEQSKFIKDLPKAVLMVEFMQHDKTTLQKQIDDFLAKIEADNLSYHQSILYDGEVAKAWKLRKAGLGVLFNMVGDAKPVALIEDTAVNPEVLPEYIAEIEQLMEKYEKQCVYYAHISAGELHLRPVLNLKEKGDRELFRKIGEECAQLVAKYDGSISGEHGDGRLRGEFIPIQYGNEILQLFKQVKDIFDPHHIFNPNKIVETPPMDEFLRYDEDQVNNDVTTIYDFSADLGIQRATEKCNGVGYCRKSEKIGGTMCPSYQATRNEKDTTRARANVLREYLTQNKNEFPLATKEVKEVLDLCLSCKACKSECPSSVDMAKLKAEAMHQYYQKHGVPFRTQMIADSPQKVEQFHFAAPIMNFMLGIPFVKNAIGFAPQRNMPKVQLKKLSTWAKNRPASQVKHTKTVHLLNDEFVNYYDVEIGKQAIQLLEQLGYEVTLISNFISGRTHLSKGILPEAKALANKNVVDLSSKISSDSPLIGLEPSTILTFRDEYLDLVDAENKQKATELSAHCFTIEEFLLREMKTGKISNNSFETPDQTIAVHGHCQQKALIGNTALLGCLELLPDVKINEIPSGCCGMAGSFGYEKEHYEVSMQIGELVLFPYVRNAKKEIIVAPGTSCRHQIKDGTERTALHPVELLWQQVKKS